MFLSTMGHKETFHPSWDSRQCHTRRILSGRQIRTLLLWLLVCVGGSFQIATVLLTKIAFILFTTKQLSFDLEIPTPRPESSGIQRERHLSTVNVGSVESDHPVHLPHNQTEASGDNHNNMLYQDRLMAEWLAFEARAESEIPNHRSKNETPPFHNLPDFIIGTYQNPDQTVILASHMSMGKSKLDRLDILHRFWQGPISLAVRILSVEEIHSFFAYYNQLPTATTDQWTVHFLLEYQKPFKSSSLAGQYCHNQLRNLALHSPSIPDFVFPVDLDFVPTFGGYPHLMKLMGEHPELWEKLKHKKLLVVPVLELVHVPDSLRMNASSLAAFAIRQQRQTGAATNSSMSSGQWRKVLQKLDHLKIYVNAVESDLPRSREELHTLFQLRLAREWHNQNGHAPSNLAEYWKYPSGNATISVTYEVRPTKKYEPYYIGYKPDLPRYWEAFRGFGLNKQSFVRECLLSGFRMEALYRLYLTHLAHPSNMNVAMIQRNNWEWTERFQPYLVQKYQTPEGLGGGNWFDKPN